MVKPNRERTIIVHINGQQKEYKWITEQEETQEGSSEVASTIEEEERKPPVFSMNELKKEPTKITTKKGIRAFKVDTERLFGIGVPVFVALIIGCIFGAVILKVVLYSGETGQPSSPETRPVVTAPEKTLPSSGEPFNKNSSFYMVQAGVFSTEEGAEQSEKILKDKGYPVLLLKQKKKLILYMGTSQTMEQAKSLAVYYKQAGIDTYWKEIQVTGASKKSYSPAEQNMLKDLLYNQQQITEASAAHLIGNHTIQPSLRQITDKREGAPVHSLIELNQKMESAWVAYDEKKEKRDLIKLQQYALEFIEQWNSM